MPKHARPSRAVTFARTGARTGVVVLGAAALSVAAAPAVAGGGPGIEPQEHKKEQKKDRDHKKIHHDDDDKKVVKKKVVEHNNYEYNYTYNSGRGSDLSNSNGLVNLSDNNFQGVLQACNNFVPVNGVGGQGAAENFTGAVTGLFGEGDATADSPDNSDDCAQGAAQQDGDNEVAADDHDDDGAQHGAGGAGGQEINNSNGLVNVADNNVQIEGQACNNYVPVNGVGGQGSAENFAGALSILQGGDASADGGNNSDECAQGAAQQDGDNEVNGGGGGQEINNSNGLVNVAGNNVQIPLQACNNFVPVNVLGGQGAVENFSGSASGLFNDEDEADAEATNSSNSDSCDQGAAQQDGDNSADLGGFGPFGDDD